MKQIAFSIKSSQVQTLLSEDILQKEYQLIKESASYKDQDNCLLICNNFNARVGLKPNYVQNDENDKFLLLPDSYISDNEHLLSARESCDHESGL